MKGRVWFYDEPIHYLKLEVVGVGRSTWGYDGRYYDTSQVKVGDVIIVEPDVVSYDVFDGEKIVEIYKVPIDKVLLVIKNKIGGKDEGFVENGG